MTFKITADTELTRLDVYLCENFSEQSRSNLQRQIENGYVLVNNKTVPKNYKIRVDDEIVVNPISVVATIEPQDIPLEVVFEDDYLLVVNKPKGMVVHPANGNADKTLVNALLHHCNGSLSGINGVIRPGIVHRIDKNTSGLLIVAKNDIAHISLAAQIKAHSFLREYQAIVYGNVKDDEGIVDLPIGRSTVDRKKMCVTPKNSRNAVTHYKVINRYKGYTHLKLTLETGRTHQIRVHLAYMGHPVAGDDVYGPKKVIKKLDGQCLHAKTIGFVHPKTGENIHLDSPLPKYFTDFLSTLEQYYGNY